MQHFQPNNLFKWHEIFERWILIIFLLFFPCFLQHFMAGWWGNYNLSCQPVDYSDSVNSRRVSILVRMAEGFPAKASSILFRSNKEYEFGWHICINLRRDNPFRNQWPLWSWLGRKWFDGKSNVNLQWALTHIHEHNPFKGILQYHYRRVFAYSCELIMNQVTLCAEDKKWSNLWLVICRVEWHPTCKLYIIYITYIVAHVAYDATWIRFKEHLTVGSLKFFLYFHISGIAKRSHLSDSMKNVQLTLWLYSLVNTGILLITTCNEKIMIIIIHINCNAAQAWDAAKNIQILFDVSTFFFSRIFVFVFVNKTKDLLIVAAYLVWCRYVLYIYKGSMFRRTVRNDGLSYN